MSFAQADNIPHYGATTSSPAHGGSNQDSTYRHLYDTVSCNIFSINNNVTALEKAYKEIGSQVDSEVFRDKIHWARQDANQLIKSTMSLLKELQRVVQGGRRDQRLQAERLENEYRITVQRYDSLQKKLVLKLKQVAVPVKQDVWGVEEKDEEESLINSERLQQQQKMQDELEFDQGMMVEREQRIKQIETDILDVNQIFRDLASLVHEQGDTIGTIEDHVSATAHEVEAGTDQLATASKYQQKYRKKLCWFMLILLVLFAVITIVVYISTK